MAKRRSTSSPTDSSKSNPTKPKDRTMRNPADKPSDKPVPRPLAPPGEPEIKYYPLNVAPAQSWLLTGQKIAAFDTVELGEYTIQCADRPFVRSLRELYSLRGDKMPADLAALPGEIYLVSHNVGVIAKAKRRANRVLSVGLSVSFKEDGSTIDLVPDTRFKEHLSIRTEGKAEAQLNAELNASGRIKVSNLLTELPSGAQQADLGFGAKIRLGGGVEVVGQISMSVKSPRIQAIGRASSMVIWQIDKDETPLVGDQVLIQTILVPKETRKLTFTLQAFVLIDPGWFRSDLRLEMHPVHAVVNLP